MQIFLQTHPFGSYNSLKFITYSNLNCYLTSNLVLPNPKKKKQLVLTRFFHKVQNQAPENCATLTTSVQKNCSYFSFLCIFDGHFSYRYIVFIKKTHKFTLPQFFHFVKKIWVWLKQNKTQKNSHNFRNLKLRKRRAFIVSCGVSGI